MEQNYSNRMDAGKGSDRRRLDERKVRKNWPFKDRKIGPDWMTKRKQDGGKA